MKFFSKSNIAKVLLAFQIAAVVFLIPQSSISAKAYSSWIQDSEVYKEFYDLDNSSTQDSTADTGTASWFEQTIAELISRVGLLVNYALSGSNINLNIDGIIYGKLAQPTKISYTSFDLGEGNIYGLVGSAIYVTLRGLIYSGFIIMFLFLLAKAMAKNGPMAREDLKQGIYSILLGFALIYIMPQLIDICLFVRDIFLRMTIAGLGASNGSVLLSIKNVFDQEKTIISAVVFCASVTAGLFYLKDYIAIAIQHTFLFAFFPGVCLMGVQKKKLMSEWAAMFFGNMLVPVIDAVGIMLPALFLQAFQGNETLGICFVVLCLLFSVRTARQQIMRIISSATGAPVGSGGLGGMGAMVAMGAARMVAGAIRRGSGGGYAAGGSGNAIEGYADWKNEASEQHELAESMTRQGREIGESLQDVNELMSPGAGFGSSGENTWEEQVQGLEGAGGTTAEISQSDEFISPEGSGNMEATLAGQNSTSALESYNGELQGADGDMPVIEPGGPSGPPPDLGMEEPAMSSVDTGMEGSGSTQLQLGEFDQARLDNLQRLDEARTELQNVQNIQSRSSQIDSNIASLQTERDGITKQNSAYPKTGTMLSSSEQRRVEEIDTRLSELHTQKAAVNKELANAPRAEKLQAAIQKREAAEKGYARISEEHGRSGKTYDSSLSMKQSMERRNTVTTKALEAAKRGMQMSRQDLEKLSPEAAAQIASIQKDVARKNNIKKAVATPIKVAGTAAAVGAGAVFSAYGGERAAVTGGIVGGLTAKGAVKGARYITQRAESASEQIMDTGRDIKDALEKNEKTLNAERRHWMGDEKTVLERPQKQPKNARDENEDVIIRRKNDKA